MDPDTLTAPSAAATTTASTAGGGNKATGGDANPTAAKVEPGKTQAKKPDLAERLTESQRKVLEKRAAAKSGPPEPPAKPDKDKPEAKTTEALPTDEVDGVIDLGAPSKPSAPEAPGEDDDAPLAELSAEEAASLDLVKKKLNEAHKDSARQRKLKQEARQKLQDLESRLKQTEEERDAAKTSGSRAGRDEGYLSQFKTAAEVEEVAQDAHAALRQLIEDPDAEEIQLPGGRVWKLVDDKGNNHVAAARALAMEIIETKAARLDALSKREASEKIVAEKLPLLAKSLPEVETRYKAILGGNWDHTGPEVSLNAALGELVTSGKYVLIPRGKQAAPPPKEKPPAKLPDLPNGVPPVRPVEEGKPDLSGLRERAMKGDQDALREWIKRSK